MHNPHINSCSMALALVLFGLVSFSFSQTTGFRYGEQLPPIIQTSGYLNLQPDGNRTVPARENPEGSESTADDENKTEDDEDDDLLDMDLDQLASAPVNKSLPGDSVLDSVVTSVSRSETSVRNTASAIHVVTQEMIRNSGATNVMDVLRTVPGVHVARVSANDWAISIRGLTGNFSNKLLVQIDGRSIYTPNSGGTYWELIGLPMRDIESIEVIRGPGSSVWGSNATSGVINIKTKSAADTVGIFAEVGGGDERLLLSTARIGGSVGYDLNYRIYGTATKDGNGFLPGQIADDKRNLQQGGFRIDWTPTDTDRFTWQGDIQDGQEPNQKSNSAYNLLTRWTRQTDPCSEFSIQCFYDQYRINDPLSPGQLITGHNIFDMESTYQTRRGRHQWVLGSGVRYIRGIADTTPDELATIPEETSLSVWNCFLQDTITLREDLAYFTMGSKFEYNDFAGFLFQPSLKLAVTPSRRTSFWASAARSTRTPTILEETIDLTTPVGGGAFIRVLGSNLIQAEEAMTYELGLRRQVTDRFFWDFAAYHTRHDDIIRPVLTSLGFPTSDFTVTNTGVIGKYGFEMTSNYKINECWNLQGAYTFYRSSVRYLDPTALEFNETTRGFPRNIAYLASSMRLTHRCSWFVAMRYVDQIENSVTGTNVDSYIDLDTRIAYQLRPGVELSVMGRNLLDSSKQEFFSEAGRTEFTENQRSVHALISFEF